MDQTTSEEKVDILVRGTLVRPHTGELEEGAIAINNGEIVAIGERPAERVLEAEFVTPGLIDAHVHVESSMTTVSGYGQAVIPRGVTSIIWDPHEIANVLGESGVQSAIRDTRRTPLKARVAVPSSVPASPLQDAGAELAADGIERLIDEFPEDIVALAEVMDLEGVIQQDPDLFDKIDAARERGLTVDGHLPGVGGAALQEAARHLETDHESTTVEEIDEKIRAGIHTYLRCGSTGASFEELLPIISETEYETRYLSICTDDRDIVDLLNRGGLNVPVQRAIKFGIDPVTTVQMATINTADRYDLPSGRLTPGAPADIVLLEDLESWNVNHVLIDGEVDPVSTDHSVASTSEISRDTVSFNSLSKGDLGIFVNATGKTDEMVTVRAIDCTQPRTQECISEVPVGEDGLLQAKTDNDLLPLAVVERHGKDAGVGTGFVHGLGLTRGAIGSTVGHDAHNLIIAGVDHESMQEVATQLRRVGGGIAAYDPKTETVETLSLPLAGLVTAAPLSEIKSHFIRVEDTAKELGLKPKSGMMTLSTLALEVIPELRMTNNGLVDVTRMEYADVIIE